MSGSSVNPPNSYPNLNITETGNSGLSVTNDSISIEVIDPNLYPSVNVTVSNTPSLTVLSSPNIVIGGGGNGGPGTPGPQGDRGSTGATGPQGVTGSGYTGAFISGSTLFMSPIIDGVVQAPAAIGTVSGGGGTETKWTNPNPTGVTIGGLAYGSNLVGFNAIEILEDILYPYQPVSFASFTVNLPSGIKDLNQPVTGNTYNAEWTTSGPTGNWSSSSLDIVRTVNGGSSTELMSNQNYNSSPFAISHPTYQFTTPTTLTFTITGSQSEQGDVNRTQSYYWLHRVYWGLSASPSISDFTGFNSEFASSTPTTARTFTGNGTDRYFYFVIPSTFTSYTSFTSAGFLYPFEPAVTISVTNAYGLSVSYKYYRSTVNSAGTATILPSIS